MLRKFHPVANLFPLMQGKPLADLVESIRVHGLLNPITVHPDDGSVIDGRNREIGCAKAGVEPRYQQWSGKGSLVAFVFAQNFDRRHLNATFRALAAIKAEPFYALEAKQRQREAGKEYGRGKKKVTQKIEQANRNERSAAAHAAKVAKSNRQYVTELKKIKREEPQVYSRIEAGELEIPEARQEIKRANRALAKVEAEQKLQADAELRFRNQFGPEGCGNRVGPYACCTCVCGDAESLMVDLSVGSIGAIVTDPPYGLDVEAWDGKVPYHLLPRFLQLTDGPVLWFGAAPAIGEAYASFDPKPERQLIWAPSFTLSHVVANGMAFRYHAIYAWRLPKKHDGPTWDVLNTPTECGSWWKHSCTKPLDLMIELCGIAPAGGVVLDPFAGSGSTLVAAKLTGRHFLGFENNPEHCDVIATRLFCRQQEAALVGASARTQ